MPTYDYECKKCGHAFEEFQSFSAKILRTCPKCKKRSLQRLIGSGGAIIFKGSGFYTTDYRSQEYKDKAKADKEAQSSADKSDTGSGTSKTDSKSKKSGDSTKKGDGGDKSSAT